MTRQMLTIELDGLTAGDYLAHACDPDPSAPGPRSLAIRAAPLGTRVEAILTWDGAAPEPCAAARAAGLACMPEVVSLVARQVEEIRLQRAA